MRAPGEQRDYWSAAAGTKEFTHPFQCALFASWVDRDVRVLDLGCGTGRVTNELWAGGWQRVVGVDTAAGMVARGARLHPHLELRTIEPGALPWSDETFGAVLLFSILTCIPGDAEAELLVDEVRRVLAPGGVVYLSDLFLQEDARNQARYEAGRTRFGAEGVFELPEGVVLRHFTRARIEHLFSDFEVVAFEELDVVTMNGHQARGFQLVARSS